MLIFLRRASRGSFRCSVVSSRDFAGFYKAELQVAASKLENFNSLATQGIAKTRQRVLVVT